MFADLLKIKEIWREDEKSQKHYLSTCLEVVRRMDLKALLPYDPIFIPNDEYLLHFCDDRILDPNLEVYDYEGKCLLSNCIVVPFRDLTGSAEGWVAFNPFTKAKAKDTGVYDEPYYFYPSKKIFKKSKSIFVLPEVYERALAEDYIIITDGFFDCVRLTGEGFNTASFLGSNINSVSAFPLFFVKNVFYIPDNDEAGELFGRSMLKLFPSLKVIRQGLEKDVDEAFASPNFSVIKKAMKYAIGNECGITIRKLAL